MEREGKWERNDDRIKECKRDRKEIATRNG
jgi:hypothetical protein